MVMEGGMSLFHRIVVDGSSTLNEMALPTTSYKRMLKDLIAPAKKKWLARLIKSETDDITKALGEWLKKVDPDDLKKIKDYARENLSRDAALKLPSSKRYVASHLSSTGLDRSMIKVLGLPAMAVERIGDGLKFDKRKNTFVVDKKRIEASASEAQEGFERTYIQRVSQKLGKVSPHLGSVEKSSGALQFAQGNNIEGYLDLTFSSGAVLHVDTRIKWNNRYWPRFIEFVQYPTTFKVNGKRVSISDLARLRPEDVGAAGKVKKPPKKSIPSFKIEPDPDGNPETDFVFTAGDIKGHVTRSGGGFSLSGSSPREWLAYLPDSDIEAYGAMQTSAVHNLLKKIIK
jgi:hypothetical protein